MRLVVLILILAACATITPAQTQGTNENRTVENELRALVKAWDDAYVKADTATLGPIVGVGICLRRWTDQDAIP